MQQADARGLAEVGLEELHRHALELQAAGGQQGLWREAAVPLQAAGRHRGRLRLRRRAEARGELQLGRRDAAPAGPGEFLQAQLQRTQLQRDRVAVGAAAGQRVVEAQPATVDRQLAELHAPGRRRTRGGRRRGRRGSRRLDHPALQVPAPVGGALHGHARLAQHQRAERGAAALQVDLRIAPLQLRQREQLARGAAAAFGQGQAVERGLRHRERQRRLVGLPLRLRLQREPARQRRHQRLRDVGREGVEREPLQRQLGLRLARADASLDTQRAGRGRTLGLRAQRGRQRDRQAALQRPAQLAGLQRDGLELQGGRRPRERVAPAHARIGQLEALELDLPGPERIARRRRGGRGRGRRRGSGRGGSRAGRCRRGGQRGHVHPALGITAQVELQAIHPELAEHQPARQRLHVAQAELQLLPGHQRCAAGLGECDVRRLRRAAQQHRRLAAARQLETQRQVGRDRAALQRHRQPLRQVTEVGHEVQVGEGELQLAAALLGERRGVRAAVEGRAVEPEGQARLDRHLHVGRDGRDEGQRQMQPVDLVHPSDRPVVEAQAAVAQLHVVERQAQRLGRRGRRGRIGGEPGQHVVQVVAAVGQARHLQHRRIHLERREHRRAAPQRGRVGVDVQACHLQQRLAGARRRADGQLAHGQLQAPGPQVDFADRHGAAEQRREPALRLRLEQRRPGQPEQRPQQQQRGQPDRDAARPALQAPPGCRGGGGGVGHP